MTEVVRAASLYCQNEEKGQRSTRNWESSGESRFRAVSRALKPFLDLAPDASYPSGRSRRGVNPYAFQQAP